MSRLGPLDPAGFTKELSGLGVIVSRETMARLEIYADLLRKWQAKINLVSPESLKDLWRRHFLDSAQLLPLLPAARSEEDILTDFGSGAGFPGLVLAILTGYRVHLIDSDQRKCAFLMEVAREAGCLGRVRVHAARFDALKPWPSSVVTARALSNLDDLLGHVAPFLTPDGVALFLKGQKAEEEVAAAGRHWEFEIERHPSRSDPSGTILKLTKIGKRGSR